MMSGYGTRKCGRRLLRANGYAYDSMHRLTSVTYPMGAYASVTPSKTYVYDSATVNGTAMVNVTNRLAEAYTGPMAGKQPTWVSVIRREAKPRTHISGRRTQAREIMCTSMRPTGRTDCWMRSRRAWRSVDEHTLSTKCRA